MKNIKIIFIAALCLTFILISAHSAFAFTKTYQTFLEQAGIAGTYQTDVQGDAGFVNSFIARMILLVISFTGLFFLALTLYSGFQWMTAGGNEDKVTEAKKRVVNGTIGVAIALTAFIITNLLFSYFNSNFLERTRANTCADIGGTCTNFEGGCPPDTAEMNYECSAGLKCCVPQE